MNVIIPEKTYTNNPFVDNILYYGKMLALNCAIKDDEEARANETKESLEAAMVYIACIEGNASYEMFPNIPKDILQDYITPASNLDIYAKDPEWLKIRLEAISEPERTKVLNRLSSLARTVYIDHYDIMTTYVTTVGTSWAHDHQEIYEACKSGTATYLDLFDELPMKTCLRIFRSYLNRYGYIDLAMLWDPDSPLTKLDVAAFNQSLRMEYGSISYSESVKEKLLDETFVSSVSGYSPANSSYKNQFLAYITTRDDDTTIASELALISKAMREVFMSHYEMMIERGYFSQEIIYDKNGNQVVQPIWSGYSYSEDLYKHTIDGEAKWQDLYPVFPSYEIHNLVTDLLGEEIVNSYNLTSLYALNGYLSEYAENGPELSDALTRTMSSIYLSNYQFYMNSMVYNRCRMGFITIYELYPYLPEETLKSIINTEFPQTSNIQVYADNKRMLNSFLGTLPADQATEIKQNIAKAMMVWYPPHHVEKNNYYRSYLGLPPIDSKGNIYEDTLAKTYDANSKSYTNFGTTYTSMCPTDIYPTGHWLNELYKYDNYDITTLQELGVLDAYREACRALDHSSRYRYLNYLGDSKLDLYTMRKAENFALMGLPTIDESDVKTKFVDAFTVNRDYIIRCVYADCYRFESDYYNKFIILFLLVTTIMDLLTGVPEYIINRDVFDARCIRYLLESYGVPYYSEIPIKYQRALIKNLNILLKYKSSTKNMIDICNLFGFSDIKVFGYYLMKSRRLESSGEYIPDENNDINYKLSDVYVKYNEGSVVDITGRHFCSLAEYPYFDEEYFMKTLYVLNDDGSITEKKIINNERELYIYDANLEQMIPLKDSTYFTKVKAKTAPAELKFIKVPIGEDLTEYKNDEDYIMDYDDITEEETWDGGQDHQSLKERILNYAFNAVKSKYISIDSITNLTEISFQTSYFYNMLFDNAYAENLLTVNVNSLQSGHLFRLTDIIFFLFALTYYYTGVKDKIMYSPTQILTIKGYNFSELVTAVMNDTRYFAPVAGDEGPLEECFDINREIAKRDYNYIEAFNNARLRVKGFNLKADIDALEKWLNDEWQMSLEDFVVSNDIDTYGQIVTLRQFYSLNNSYYQKNISSGFMTPSQYNNIIKYAYSYYLLDKVWLNDIAYIPHRYVIESITDNESSDLYNFLLDIVAVVAKSTKSKTYNEILEQIQSSTSYEQLANHAYLLDNIYAVADTSEYETIINSMSSQFYNLLIETPEPEFIYVLNNQKYGAVVNGSEYKTTPLYNFYKKSGDDYVPVNNQYYVYNQEIQEYLPLINGLIYVKNLDGILTFGTDQVFVRNTDGEYTDIDYDKYTKYDQELNARILNLGDYFIKDENGKWILDPSNCYIKARIDGKWQYILLRDIEDYTENYIEKDDCFVQTEDGHFIPFKMTDYYIRTHNDTIISNEMEYREVPLYVEVANETDVYDASLPIEQRAYYKKLEDFYTEDGFAVSKNVLYVKDADGNYIPEWELLVPSNTWYYDQFLGKYVLVVDSQYSYLDYENPTNVLYIMVLHGNYDYYKYALEASTGIYRLVDTKNKRYSVNSNDDKITVFDLSKTYKDTSRLIISLNLPFLEDAKIADDIGYNPSLKDGLWDENDWFYEGTGSDSGNVIEMHGENIWYYKKPGESSPSTGDNEIIVSSLESGYVLPSTEYMGSTSLIEGEEYYLSLDLTTNFSGIIRVYCTADVTVNNIVDRNYTIEAGSTIHIDQTFRANSDTQPQLRIVKYDFDHNPIHIGDIVEIANLKITKAYSEHYIPEDIASISQLLSIYNTNKAIYKWLLTQMHNTSNKDMYYVYQTLYDALMITEYNKEIFKEPDGTYALTYTDFLKTRDSILYNILIELQNMDPEMMQKAISEYIIDCCYALTEYLNGVDLKHLYNYFPGVSANFIQQYLFKIINWFKSWKVHLLGINTLYRMGNGTITDENGNVLAEVDGDEFTVKILHKKVLHDKLGMFHKDGFIKDTIQINPLDGTSPDGRPYSDKYDFSDSVTRMDERIPLRDRIRMIIKTGNHIEFRDNETQMHLILDDDSTDVSVKDGNVLTIKTINGDEFTVADKNQLMLSTNQSPEDVFISQIIGEINLLSGDYISTPEDDEDEE